MFDIGLLLVTYEVDELYAVLGCSDSIILFIYLFTYISGKWNGYEINNLEILKMKAIGHVSSGIIFISYLLEFEIPNYAFNAIKSKSN